MAIIQVNLTDTINSFRVKTNTLALQVGDTALLDTSGADSNTVSSINSLVCVLRIIQILTCIEKFINLKKIILINI